MKTGPAMGDVITIKQGARFYDTKSVGRRYVLFLDKENGDFVYSDCDYALTDDLTNQEVYRMTSLEIKDTIEYLIRNYKMACTERELPPRAK